MARFISAVKSTGILKNTEIDIIVKKNPYLELLKNQLVQEEIVYNNESSVLTDNFEELKDIDDRRFWMNLQNPSKAVRGIVKNYKLKLKFYETITAVISLLAVLILQFEYELEYYPKHYNCDPANPNNDCEYRGQPVRVIVSIGCFCLCITTILSAKIRHEIQKEQKKIVIISFYKSYFFFQMLLELIVDAIHPFPFYDYTFNLELLGKKISYNLMTLFYAFIFLKLYKVIRILAAYTSYSDHISEKYCEIYGGEADTVFVLKSVQKDSPFLILTISIILMSVILGIVLRMFEILDVEGGGDVDFKYFTNGIWCIIIIMTTVGYGDFYPKTHLGQIVAVLTIVIGTLLTSLTIVALNGIIEFNSNEKQAFVILQRTVIRKKLHNTCQQIISINFKIYKFRKKFDFNNKILLDRVDYMKLLRKIHYLGKLKNHLELELNRDTFLITDKKFISLNENIEEELFHIKESFKLIQGYKYQLKKQVRQQKNLIENLEDSLRIIRNL